MTAYALRSRAGFVSHRQRSWDSPFGAFFLAKGTRAITARMSPSAVLPSGDTSTRGTGPARSAAAFGISPFRESLAIRQSVSPPARWMLPWVLAFQGPSSTALPEPSPGLLSRALQTWRLLALPAGAPEYRSAFDPPLRLLAPKHPGGRSSPRRLCAPAQSRTFRRETHLGYGFTSHCVVHCCRPANALG